MQKENQIIEPQVINANNNVGDIVMVGASGFLLVLVFMIGGVLAVGIITGLMSAMGFGFLLYKLKQARPEAWNWMIDHPLATDCIVSLGFILLLAPATATGIIAGASAAMFASAGISMANRFIGKVQGVESKLFSLPKFNKTEAISVI